MKNLIKKHKENTKNLLELNIHLSYIDSHNIDVGNCYIDDDFIDDEPIILEIKAIKRKIEILENTISLKTYFFLKKLLKVCKYKK